MIFLQKGQIFGILGGPGRKTGSRTLKKHRNYCCFCMLAEWHLFILKPLNLIGFHGIYRILRDCIEIHWNSEKPLILVQWTPSESLIFLRNYWYSRSWGAAGRKITKFNGNTANFTKFTGIL